MAGSSRTGSQLKPIENTTSLLLDNTNGLNSNELLLVASVLAPVALHFNISFLSV